MSRPTLSEKQLKVYNFLVKKSSSGLPPTVREICLATGIKSTSTVHAILSVLEDNGYQNVLLIGSDAVFGGRELYFKSHGNYQIRDYKYANEHGLIPKDYYVWWGYEDNKLINIEARTMVDMVMHQILPAAIRYSAELAGSANQKRDAFGNRVKALAEQSISSRLSEKCDSLYEKTEKLYSDLKAVPTCDSQTAADYYNDVIVPGMQAVRKDADFLEKLTPKRDWPYPIYSDLLFY